MLTRSGLNRYQPPLTTIVLSAPIVASGALLVVTFAVESQSLQLSRSRGPP